MVRDVILAAATMGGMGALLALQEQIVKGMDLGVVGRKMKMICYRACLLSPVLRAR